MEYDVEILAHPTEDDWMKVKMLALNTIGKTFISDKPLSKALKEKYLISEHSPIRALQFIIRMNIPYYISTHLVRHKYGVEHFVQSQRNDRQEKYDRNLAPQNAMVSHIMLVNAQALMTMSHKRLCGKADPETQKVWRTVVKKILESNPEFEPVLIQNCEYLGRCPEFQTCGRWDVICKRKQ